MATGKKTKPLGLRDASLLPITQTMDDDGFLQRIDLLDHDAPIGAYQVDKVAIEMLRIGRSLADRESEVVRSVRIAADLTGSQSVDMAREILSEPERYDQCERLFSQLDTARKAIALTLKVNPEKVAGFIAWNGGTAQASASSVAEGLYKVKVEAAESDAVDILKRAADFKDQIDKFFAEYKLPRKVREYSEPWTGWFIECAALHWRSVTGDFVRSNDTADFRRFLVAAWSDLRFPDPLDRDGNPKPLEDHFRDRLAKSDIFERYGSEIDH